MRLAVLAAAALLGAPAAAWAGAQPGSPPPICAGDAFADIVGTGAGDRIEAPGPAARIYGLGGPDELIGSRTRATCLFGGPGDDYLNLNAGGGVARGEDGRDVLFGSIVRDIVAGGPGVDGAASGAGDDTLTFRDGIPELVDCGVGDDIVKSDRADVLVGCESVTAAGPAGLTLKPAPRVTDIGGTVRARMTLPAAGTYRVLYVTPADGRRCSGGPLELASLTGARRGRRVRLVLRRPELGWCEGTSRVAVVRDPGGGLPVEPVARLAFRVL
jgi:hypothetical protein